MLLFILLTALSAPAWRFVELAGSLCLVIVALLLIVRLLRGRNSTGPNPRMKLVERLMLEPRRGLHLVQLDDETLLIATSERGVELLRRTPPERLSSPEPQTSTGDSSL